MCTPPSSCIYKPHHVQLSRVVSWSLHSDKAQGYRCCCKYGKNIGGNLHSLSCFLPSFGLSKNLHFTMGAGRDRTYSTLEAVPRQIVYQTYQQEKPLPTDLGKQVAPHEGKQVSLHDGKQHMGNDDGIEVAAKEDSYAYHYGDHHVQVHRPSRKKRILVGGAIGLIAIFAAVLGTVLGIKHKRSATTSSPSPSNTSVESPPATPPQRNIAALSFASNSVNNTRVYFQDNVGQIMEAANSADNTTWIITRTGIIGKNGSAIAAAVSRPGFPLVSHVSSIPIDSYRYLFRRSAYSIWISVTLSTKLPTPPQQASGHRELYQVKDTPQCQIPA